jgi:hypothetical protein
MGNSSRVAIGRVVEQIVAFLRVGQPVGAPPTGYLPLLALLRRQVSDNEITDLATQFARNGVSTVTVTDIGVAITAVVDGLPAQVDIQRVSRRLAADGWTIQ